MKAFLQGLAFLMILLLAGFADGLMEIGMKCFILTSVITVSAAGLFALLGRAFE